MEVLLLLIAVTAIVGVLVLPALRRRREAAGAVGQVARPETRYGFVPTDQLDIRLPGPDRDLVDALEEAQRGQDWQPVARLLALTDDWELRWQRVQSLAGAAAMELAHARRGASAAAPSAAEGEGEVSFRKDVTEGAANRPSASASDGRWLRDWRSQQPNEVGGAEVYAQFLVWQAMSERTPESRRIILEEARKVCRETLELAPADDPTPLISEVFVVRMLGLGRADFDAVWSALKQRAPRHMGAHLAALPYLSEKGQGSRKEAYAFAEAAAADARPGTLLSALPLFAVYDHLPEANLVHGLYQSAIIEQAIEGAQYAVQHAPADHAVLPHVRHLLLLFLVRAERYPEALAEVRAVDGHVGAVPWVDGDDARALYAAYRALAVAGCEGQGGDPASLTPPSSY